MSDQQSRTETLSNQVHRQLLAAIRVGEYAGQNRLPSETEMAAHFEVSRPVLRQALERLRTAGIVAARRGSGNYVVDFGEASFSYDPLRSIPDIQKCLEFRCAVEGQAAATAARRRSPAQLDGVEETMRAFQTAISGGQAAVETDFAFHLAIARATNNPYFARTLTALRAHITFGINLIHTLSTRPSAARLREVLREHDRIVDAIRRSNPDAAQRRMTEHLQAGIDRLFSTSDDGRPPLTNKLT